MNFPSFILSFSQTAHFFVFSRFPPIFFIGIFIVLFLFGLVLTVLLGLLVQNQIKKRVQALHAFAVPNGWSVSPNVTPDFFQNHESYTLFSDGNSKQIVGMLSKPLDGGKSYIFDYTYIIGSTGSQKRKSYHTVVALHTPNLNLPNFALYPESSFGFLGEMLGFNDIDFDSHPKFSKAFKLSGKDIPNIRRAFTPTALSLFEQFPNVRVDGGGNYLFVYITNQMVPPEKINGFVSLALNIYGSFRGFSCSRN